MHKISLILLLLQVSLIFGAQFDIVSEIEEDPLHMGLMQMADNDKLDNNGELGALVIVNCGIQDLFFKNMVSKISQIDKSGAYWVVMKQRAQYFVLSKEGFANYRYDFPTPLVSGAVYKMTIDELNKQAATVTLVITSNQDKASVYVKGELIGKTENKLLTIDLPLGNNEIEVRKSGFKSKSITHNLSPENNKVEINLQAVLPTAVTITTEPEGASVYIDNVLFGTSPKSSFFDEGTYPIKIEKESYATINEEITIKEPETKKHFKLKDIRATLTIKTNPGATVTLNGTNYKGGLKDQKLNPQTINIKVEEEFCETISESYTLKENEVKVFDLYPKDVSAKLTINTSDNATIKVNDIIYTSVNNLKFPASVVEIEVSQPKAKTIKQVITLKQEDVKSLDIYPVLEKGTISVVTIPTSASIELTGDAGELYTAVGRKSFTDIPIGTYELVITNDGFKTHTETIKLTAENIVQKQISLEEGSDISDTFVFVQGGAFQMGSNSDGSDEKPIHRATLSDFYIGKYEVTQTEWQEVMGNNPSEFKGDINPVEKVTWYDAVEFCNKKSRKEGLEEVYSGSGPNIKCDFSKNGYRLPTEAEWEFAAKGGNKSKDYTYSGSNNIDEVAWYADNSNDKSNPVGDKKANELGIYDMSGNVWEWCWDWYGSYSLILQSNPTGSTSGSNRVIRGGGWGSSASFCRVAIRSSDGPSVSYYFIGFRLARSSE